MDLKEHLKSLSAQDRQELLKQLQQEEKESKRNPVSYTHLSFPLMIHRAQQAQTEAAKRFIRAQQEAVINERINRQVVAKDIEYEHGVAPEQNGLRLSLIHI